MSVDLATLAIAVDSQQVKGAALELDKLAQAGGRAETATTKLTGASTSLATAVKAVAASYAVWKVAEYIKEAALLNARYETLGIVLNVVGRNAGYTSTQMATFTDGVRKQGISLVESRQAVINMAQAQLDLSKSSQLARVAQDAAVIGGINSSEAFGRMVVGIKSGQTEILRTIGLNVSFEQSYAKLAKELGTTTGALTEGQKAQARMNGVLEEGTRIAGVYEAAMDTAGKQLTSMTRYTEDLKVVIGETFNDILVVAVEAVTNEFKGLNAEARELAQQGQLRAWGEDIVRTMAFVADAVMNTAALFKTAGNAIAATALSMKAAATNDSALYASAGKSYADDEQTMLNNASKFRDAADVRIAANQKHRQANAGLATVLKELDGLSKAGRGKAVPGAVGKIDDLYFNGGLSDAEYNAAIGEATGKNVTKSAGGTSGGTSRSGGTDKRLDFIKSLRREVELLGVTDGEKRLFDAGKLGITGKAMGEVRALSARLNEYKQSLEAAKIANQEFDESFADNKAHLVAIESAIAAYRKQNEQIAAEADLIGLTNIERETAVRLRELEIVGLSKYSAEWEKAGAAIKKASETSRLSTLIGDADFSKLKQDQEDMVLLAKAFTDGIEQSDGSLKKLSESEYLDTVSKRLGLAKDKVEELDDFAKNAAKNIQDSFADFLFDPFKDGMDGMLKNFGLTIKRMVAEAVAADLAKRLFGDSAKGGEGDGVFGGLLKGIGNIFTGGGSAGGGAGALAGADSASWFDQIFAQGGVPGGSGISAYSNSIVTKPTIFAFAQGAGLMGEKPGSPGEAIMPLSRMPDGDLGVKVSGGETSAKTTNNINVYISGSSSAPDVRRAAGQGAREALAALSGAQRYG